MSYNRRLFCQILRGRSLNKLSVLAAAPASPVDPSIPFSTASNGLSYHASEVTVYPSHLRSYCSQLGMEVASVATQGEYDGVVEMASELETSSSVFFSVAWKCFIDALYVLTRFEPGPEKQIFFVPLVFYT